MSDCPTCEYHKQRAQIWRDEVYRLGGHPLPRKENSMTHEEQIAKLTEMLEIQQKLHETAIDMLKPAIEAEREACALICDAVSQDMSLGPLEKYRASWLANEIRARGQA
jgi:hypothetical protein